MLGLVAAIQVGAASFIKRKFSASSFWEEAQRFNTTALVYIGELCRYLANQEPCDAEQNNPIVSMVGNGLRPDVWDEFRDRFKVERIIEIYGASEGNALFINLFNKDKTIGMTSADVALIEYDVADDEIIKNADGTCKKIMNEDPGLLIVKIGPNAVFNGYTDAQASEKKILRDVFEEGDAWFNTGDLIRKVDVGFALGKEHYQFVDRIGDTFRWKSENVSTNEVGEILNGYHDVNMSNVYGVKIPGCEGRAGMVAFSLENARGTMRPDYWKNSLLINNFEMAGPKRGQGNAREYLQNMINEGHNHFRNELQGTHVTNVEPHTARFWNKIVDEGMLDGAHERADIRTDLSGSRHGVYAYDPHTFEPWMHELGEDYAEYYDLPTDQWYQDAME